MKLTLSILIILFIFSCSSGSKKIKHSFFVAGHAYGSPITKSKLKEGESNGLHQPFKDKFEFLKVQDKMYKGFLLGDVVWKPSNWEQTLREIETIGVPIEIVRGNHDGKLKLFEEKFGKSYKKYIYKNNLYILLDSNLDHWNISGDQLVFLMNTLRIDSKKVNNIFIMVHHLLWHSKEKFSKPIPNSTYGKAEETNFWSKVEPLLRNQRKPVFIFAGDMGAFTKEYRKQEDVIEYFYHNYDNITFIGTGMGGGLRDNFIIVDVYNDDSVKFRLISLNGDNINSLGKLEEY